ncbi:MAG: potassium channel family protein [Pseudomonadota bacterium]
MTRRPYLLRPAASPQRFHKLFTKSKASPKKTLLIRAVLAILLIVLVVMVYWFDRDGLKDHADGNMSFTDIIYFTMVTVTTVGYGDIVPVSDRARLIDAFLVTPIRLFIWFIFLGTAYQFVIQRIWEDMRMARMQQRLREHVIICGFGHSGRSAAPEIVGKGIQPEQIVVIDLNEEALQLAAENGYTGMRGDPTQERVLLEAGVERAKAVIICLGRDDANVLVVLTARNLNSNVRIICSVKEEENLKLIRQAGASVMVSPAKVGGYLLADAVDSSFTSTYVFDLLTSGGQVKLIERAPHPEEIGKPMRELSKRLVARIYRDGSLIEFWEDDKSRIQEGDVLLVIERTADR